MWVSIIPFCISEMSLGFKTCTVGEEGCSGRRVGVGSIEKKLLKHKVSCGCIMPTKATAGVELYSFFPL